MREISIVFLILYLITITYSQNLIKHVVFEPSNTTIPINFTNITNTGINYSVNCAFIPLPDVFVNRFAHVVFNGGTKRLNSDSIYDVAISNLKAGRVRGFNCILQSPNLSNLPSVLNFLSIKPAFAVLVCENVTAVSGSTASVTVKFSDPLPDNGNINCEGNVTAVSKDSRSIALKVSGSSNPNKSCTLTYGSSLPIDFIFSVTFISPSIWFSPDIVESNSPKIKLNLISNYAVSGNCTIAQNRICPPLNEGNWILSPNSFTFSEPSSILLTMSRSGSISNSSENLNVVCCSINNILLTSATVTIKNSAYEFTVITNATETNYGDLQFTRLSDCPCDLIVGICEPNCCCDTFCNCSSNVNRINGPYGGYFNDPLPRSCNYQDDLIRQPYQSLLCVVNESPNIIGDYYPMQSIINDLTTLNALVSSNRKSGFQIKTPELSTESKFIIPISTNNISSILTSKYLYLPRQVIDSSKCDLQNPVVMLQPYDSNCSHIVTTTNCATTTDPRLSSFFYLLSTTSVESKCTNQIEITAINDIPVFTFFKCGATGSCVWNDNGYNLPPPPSINGNLCKDAVDSVSYTIYYNNTDAVYINANISIKDVPVNTLLDQRFTVSFVSTNSTRATAANQSFPYLQSILNTTVSKISGRYGYDDGKPIITRNNSSESAFGYLKTLPISVSGNCDDKIVNDVLFRQDSLVQCKYVIPNKNCTDNRSKIKIYLDSLVNSKYVAIYGNPVNSNDFIPINTNAPIDLTNANNPYYPTNQNANLNNPINDMNGYCANITTGLTVTIYYSRQGKARGQHINNIVSVVQRYQYSNVSYYSPVGSNDTISNSIMLTAYHSFVLVPSNIAGTQNVDNNVQVVCLFDVCLNELFYPWMYNYEGKQGFYEESFGLFLLGLAIFLLVTTYPWW